LIHDIFFWLGSKTSQDDAGTAVYKTVELDEFLHGVAIQHREIQQSPSDEFMALFPKIKILSGGVQSGFRHVDTGAAPKEISTLLRIFNILALGELIPWLYTRSNPHGRVWMTMIYLFWTREIGSGFGRARSAARWRKRKLLGL
jgi:hypothetical protein